MRFRNLCVDLIPISFFSIAIVSVFFTTNKMLAQVTKTTNSPSNIRQVSLNGVEVDLSKEHNLTKSYLSQITPNSVAQPTILWTPEAEAQIQSINQRYPFDIQNFKRQVASWIRQDGNNWRSNSTHVREFILGGNVKSLQVNVVTQVRNGGVAYFQVITKVLRD